MGSHLVDELKKTKTVIEINKKTADLNDWGDLKSFSCNDIDIIYHLAAKTDIFESKTNPLDTLRNNIISTLNILEFCRLKRIKLIFISSYLYGNPIILPTNENEPLHPNNPYSYSKFICENLCRCYFTNYNVSCIILRPFNIYGEGQSEKTFSIPTIIRQLFSGKVVIENIQEKRDYIHIDDVVTALLKAGDYSKKEFDVFNIGTGKCYSLLDIINQLITISGREAEIIINNKYQGAVATTLADISKTEKELEWNPKIDIITGLSKMLDYYEKH